MGTVEIAYELRALTPVIVGSPTEVEGEGMPYHLNIPAFFADGTLHWSAPPPTHSPI